MHVGLGAFFQALDGRSDSEAYAHELAIVDEAGSPAGRCRTSIEVEQIQTEVSE